MMTIWQSLTKLLNGKHRIVEQDALHSVILCSGCHKDVRLPRHHWCHPTKNEDVRFWACPVCVNMFRKDQGLPLLNRYGRDC